MGQLESEITIINRILNVDQSLPFVGGIMAGFPSPAADYLETEIDLLKYICPNPLSTFIGHVTGDSMIGAHIPKGAYIVIDKSIKPAHNMIVVAFVNGEPVLKRLIKEKDEIILQPENPAYKPIHITGEMHFIVWGTVTKVITDVLKEC